MSDGPAIKAYQVRDHVHGEASVIAFAVSPGEAKSIAMRSLWLEDSSWIDLRCWREPRADGFLSGPGLADGSGSIGELRLMRGLGWWNVCGSGAACDGCGLSEWIELSESKVGPDGLCVECRKAGDGLNLKVKKGYVK